MMGSQAADPHPNSTLLSLLFVLVDRTFQKVVVRGGAIRVNKPLS